MENTQIINLPFMNQKIPIFGLQSWLRNLCICKQNDIIKANDNFVSQGEKN